MKFALTKTHTGKHPTLLGWLISAILTCTVLLAFSLNIYSFLAPETQPHTGILVIEGWIGDEPLDEAILIYRAGNYSKIICTGLQIETGSYLQAFKSYSEMTKARLQHLGLRNEEIIATASKETKKNRTYGSAVALKELLLAENIEESNVHLITVGPHGRRSRYLFQLALGSDHTVGISSLEESGYDSKNWYTTSAGVRTVLGELIGYLSARVFFHPVAS